MKMKKFLLLLSLTFILSVSAVPMGHFDKVSNNWLVRNNFFTCTFLEGSMFPGEFVFSNGKTPGIILFRDTATDGNKPYMLREERWAKTKIIRNDPSAFIIERSGKFYRNSSPLIAPLKSVDVTCRYEFKKDSPEVRIKFFYRKKADVSVKINSGIHLVWYFKNPFDRVLFKGKWEKFSLPAGKKFRAWDTKDKIVLEGKEATIALQSPRVIAAVTPSETFPCSFNGGTWQFLWKNGTAFKSEAVLTLKSK